MRYRLQENSMASRLGGRAATVDGRGTVDLLDNLVQSIVANTNPNYDIAVVDAGTSRYGSRRG